MVEMLKEPSLLGTGVYLQLVVEIKLLDDAIIRCNEPEEVMTHHYKELGNRFIIPWRKVKGKLRRLVLEKQRGLGIHAECALKDDLCLNCPSCLLFGGTGETSSAKVSYNILSRVLGESFISTEKVVAVENYTQNAVGEKDLKTGQALMTVLTVPKETVFRGVVTIKDPTKEMASIIYNNLLRLTRIGARSVEWGRVETRIIGGSLSDRETVSVYNLLQNKDQLENIESMVQTLPGIDESYQTLNGQIPGLLKDIVEKRGGKEKKSPRGKKAVEPAADEAETTEES
ncbi:MAG: type I-D CRISPR-associated protein Cas7/Csc2 [Candidatus Wallbacteria bacterium]|nr:type I-D CRISPR-associated protein Cas7/Csc2 [Candidatus Wallbacteria bacterium]